MIDSAPLSRREVLGINREAPAQAWRALRGDPHLPRSRFGLTSVKIFTPKLALATWAGRRPRGRAVPVVNLPNRTPTPIADGWSVRVTQVRDFRGGALTYDSHNGTDYAVPPGTVVTAAAPGRVVALRREFDRGGLKLYVDHGGGLMSSYHHLARALVDVDARVARGQPLALSGYSGIDALASFPWVAPHVHSNVYLGGRVVDPFAAEGEISLWRGDENRPLSARASEPGDETRFDAAAVDDVVGLLRDDDRRAVLARIPDVDLRAWALVIEACTYPSRFGGEGASARLFSSAERRPLLSLPFHADDFDGILFADDERLSLPLQARPRPAPPPRGSAA